MGVERTFGGELRRFRVLRGLSQESLEERSGVSVRTIRSLESDAAARRRASTLGKLFDALELGEADRVDLFDLYTRVTQVSPSTVENSDTDVSIEDGPDEHVAALVRELRRRKGWTQRELASHARVHYRTVSNLERGTTTAAQPATAFRLGQASGLRDDELERFVAALTRHSAPEQPHASGPGNIFGRVEELSEVVALLDAHRWVTIVGGGGVGKTTLARAVIAAHPERSATIELADQPVGRSATDAIADAMTLDGSSIEDIGGALRGIAIVLVDNVEHLADVDDALEGLLAELPAVRLLVTSRWASGQASQHGTVLHLGSLDLPAAVTLLGERASEVGCLESWLDESGPFEQICSRVDRLPLAIELAAAWSRMISPEELLARLDRPLGLLDRRSSGDGRHESVRSAIGWTVDLLSPVARRLFAELSVHPTSVTLQLIEGTHTDLEDPLGSLGELVDVGLIEVLSAESPSRFRMLRVVREVAAELIDSTTEPALRRRRADWVLKFLDGTDAKLTGVEQAAWLRRLDLEREHLAAAFDDLVRAGSPDGLRLGVAMWRYWQQRGLYERGRAHLTTALNVADDAMPALEASAQYGRSVLAYLGGNVDEAIIDAAAALDGYRSVDDPHGAGSVHSVLGMIEQHRNQLDASERWYREGLSTTAPRRAPRAYATLQANLSSLLAQRGELIEAVELVEAAIARFESLGDDRGVADNSGNMALWELAAGQPTSARTRAKASQVVYEQLGDPQGQADTHLALAEAAMYLDESEVARSHLRAATVLVEDISDPWDRPVVAALQSWLDLLDGDVESARSGALRACVDADDLPYPHAQVRAHAAAAFVRVEQGREQPALDSITAALGHAEGHRVIAAMMAALTSGLAAKHEAHISAASRLGRRARAVLDDMGTSSIVERALGRNSYGRQPSADRLASATDLRHEALDLVARIAASRPTNHGTSTPANSAM